jgi:hypothetical protein
VTEHEAKTILTQAGRDVAEVLSVTPMMAFGPGNYFVTWRDSEGRKQATYLHP